MNILNIIKEVFIFMYTTIKYKIINHDLTKKERFYEVIKELSFKETNKVLNTERKQHKKNNDLALIGLMGQELQIHIDKQYLELFGTIVNAIQDNQDILLQRCTIFDQTNLSIMPITEELSEYVQTQEFLEKITRVLSYQTSCFLDKKLQPIIKKYQFHIQNFKDFNYLVLTVEFVPLKEVKTKRLGD